MADPLILTLAFDAASQARFQAARDRWFPPERNLVPAHLTLFHHLPGDRADAVAARIAAVVADTAPIPVRVTGVLSLGKGAAFRLDVPGVEALRSRIGSGLDLTEQDRRGFRAHVTVQNKVDRPEAARTVEALRAGFAPWRGLAVGLDLWRYRGGPWQEAGHFPFAGRPPTVTA